MARFSLVAAASVKDLGEQIMRAGIEFRCTGVPDPSIEAQIISLLSVPAATNVDFHYDSPAHLHIVVPNTDNIEVADIESPDPGVGRLKAIASEAFGSAVLMGCQM